MKIKKIIRKMYLACIRHNTRKEKKLWFKAMRKSLKHKHTEIIQ